MHRSVHARHAAKPRHPVLICNPWSGGGKVSKFGLVDLAHDLGVETVMLDHGLDLEQLARDAISRGADCLGMAGGDGSQALVASIAVEHDLPFVCVTAGTRNHFALDLGLDRDDPRGACTRSRRRRPAHRLRHRQRSLVREQRVARRLRHHRPAGVVPRTRRSDVTKAMLPEMLGDTTTAVRPAVHRSGRQRGGRRLPDPGVEQPLRDGGIPRRLAAAPDRHRSARRVRRHRGDRPGRAKVIAMSAVGQRSRSKDWHEFTTESFQVRSRRVMRSPESTAKPSTWQRRSTSRSTRQGLKLPRARGQLGDGGTPAAERSL